jgi:hypothetical protein
MVESGTHKAEAPGTHAVELEQALKFLTADMVTMIDGLLHEVAPFGEVTLRVKDGELRSVGSTKGYDAFKLQREGIKEGNR